jgi:hypothetical protein
MAVLGDGPITGKTDGVVAYESAHIDGVASEVVVRSPHSTQGHPETIEECVASCGNIWGLNETAVTGNAGTPLHRAPSTPSKYVKCLFVTRKHVREYQ